jgi:hypothetical protein
LQFNEFLQEAREQVRTAKDEGNNRHALQALREGTRILNFINKMDVPFDKITTYHLMASPQWPGQDSLFPTDLNFRSGVRLALSQEFFGPCPDIPPDAQLDAWDNEGAAAADQAKVSHLGDVPSNSSTGTVPSAGPENLLPPPAAGQNCPAVATAPQTLDLNPDTLTLLQEIFVDLLNAETEPKNKREKSAKKPKNIPSFALNISGKQSPSHGDKNLPKNPPVGRESKAPPANMTNAGPSTNRESKAPPAGTQLRTQDSELNTAPFGADKDYEVYLREKAAAENQLRTQNAADNQSLETQNSKLETSLPEVEPPIPETPKPRKQFLHPIEDAEEYNYAVAHGHRREDRPAYIPDRRWEEDFGNPRRFKGAY